MLVQRVDIVVLLDELDGSLLTHAGHTGNIVGRVPHKSLDVDELSGRHTIAFHDVGVIHSGELGAAAGRRIEHVDIVVHQLKGVLIPCDNLGLRLSGFPLLGQGADNIVGLVALLGDRSEF